MNALKNLMIIAVLAAVGYGVYVSLSRNNVEPGQQFGSLKGGDASTTKTSLTSGGPLALGDNRNAGTTAGFGAGAAAPPLPTGTAAAPPRSSAMPLLGAPAQTNLSATAPPPAANAPNSVPQPMNVPNVLGEAPGSEALPPANSVAAAGAVRNLSPPPGSPANPVDPQVQNRFASFMENVQKSLDNGELAKVHLVLSNYYDKPDVPADQAKQITRLLDQLAGTVIYSRQHLLEPAYVTQPGDTVEKIARKYNVPWQLLARINGLMPLHASNAEGATKDQPLPPGTPLKVLRGPFDAVVRLDRHELTLTVQDRYAGRFAVGVGRDAPKLEGEYTICAKTLNPAYYGPDSVNFSANDPKNPYGGAWIGLTDRIGIHGAADPQSIGRDDNPRGFICVGDRDIQDLYGILSVGSRVKVLR
jgi:hypothetical protein